MSIEKAKTLKGEQSKIRNVALPKARPLSIGIILAPNFTLSAFSLFVDTLRLGADESDRSRQIRCHWTVMAGKAEAVRSSCNIQVSRTSAFRNPREFDYIAVIGGTLHGSQEIDEETRAYLKAAARERVTLIGICTGSFILSRLGLLDNRRVCVSWLHYQEFCEEFPDRTVSADRLFEIDGDRITCAGGAAAADLAAWLLKLHVSQKASQKPHHVLLLDRVRNITSLQPHPPIADMTKNVHIRRALLLMEQHLSNPLPIASIATSLALSTRQLERLFQTELSMHPSTCYRALRLRYARWLLNSTSRSITEIALDSGFSDGAHFSRQFKAAHGCAPSDLRGRSNKAEDLPADPPFLQGWLQQQPIECAGSRIF